MITYTDKNIYWNYFLSIEKDLNKLSRFIEFDKKNENVFSIELARLLISSSSEFEVVSKEFCKIKNQNSKIENINDIRREVLIYIPDIYAIEINISRFGLNYKPLINWETNNNCDWWTSYNGVKHRRNIEYENANLKNAINAIGALYIINLYYYNSLQEKNTNKTVKMEETTLELKPRPCLIKVNRPDFYMIPFCTSYQD